MYLQSQLLKLRAAEPEDLELLYRWENNTGIWQVSDTLVPFSRYQLRRFLEAGNVDIFANRQLRLMIDLLDAEDRTVRTAGTLDLFDFDALNGRAGVGILIADKADRRCGYARETLRLVEDYCRDVLQLHQLYACVTESNAESIRLFRGAGYVETGRRIAWMHTPRGWEDQLFFQRMLNKSS